MDNDGLWSEIYADDDLKQAILLYCLSPFDKEDMIHIGLITNPGEGKNHLVDKVISPLVRCRWREQENSPHSPLCSVLCPPMI